MMTVKATCVAEFGRRRFPTENSFKFELGANVAENAERGVRSARNPISTDVQRCLASLC
jgi:hypothetical protein